MKKRHIFLIVFLLFAWVFAALTRGSTSGSTFSAEPRGAKAFYLLLKAEGVPAERWFYPFSELKKRGASGVMFLASPEAMGAEEALSEWVKSGNRLVIFNYLPGPLRKLLKTLGFKDELTAEILRSEAAGLFSADADYMPLECAGETACNGVSTLSRPALSISAPQDAQVLEGRPDASRFLKKRLGEGEVWFFSGPEPLWNQNIDRFDNLKLLYQLASDGGTVFFDEFHHGYAAPVAPENRAGFYSLVLCAAYLALVILLAAAGRAVRFGPPALEGPQESLASTDFAAVLGLLYFERGADRALKHYLSAWRARIERRYGISRRLPVDALLRDLRREGALDEHGARMLQSKLEGLERLASGESLFEPRELDRAVSQLEAIASARSEQAAAHHQLTN